jgi:hypothetical protein
MGVDNIEYKEAEKTMLEMAKFNKTCMLLPTLPYKIGIFTAVISNYHPTSCHSQYRNCNELHAA